MSAFRLFLRRLSRRVWFRAALFTVAAVLLVLLARLIEPIVPPSWVEVDLGQDSLGTILQILASSMLAVTTFSVAAVVAAYSSAASNGTPRATQLMVSDRTSLNALSTFLGAFVFSIVGIVALSTNYYHESGRVLLFLGTLAVIAIIVVTLLGWISHLTNLGRMSDVITRVERAAMRAMNTYAHRPRLGGAPLTDVPAAATAVHSADTGYVTHIDVGALNGLAERSDVIIHVNAAPGAMADAANPLARIEGEPTDDLIAGVRSGFRVEKYRTYEQDPRLGLVALSEIASRALSPAINDPGTAIQVLSSLERVLLPALTVEDHQEPTFARVHVPRPFLKDLVEDAFRPISRDGAGSVEVMIRLQKTMLSLAAAAPTGLDVILRDAATRAWERTQRSMTDPGDLAAVERIYDRHEPAS